jgi:hypothetical protein
MGTVEIAALGGCPFACCRSDDRRVSIFMVEQFLRDNLLAARSQFVRQKMILQFTVNNRIDGIFQLIKEI